MMITFTQRLARGTLATLFAFFFVLTAWAQDRTISGTVTSETGGEPLPGVNVIVKGTTIGTVTNIDGNYSLQVPDDQSTLQFSFIGYTGQEVEINGRSAVDISMSEDVGQLSEVIVTAQGIEREKRSLGYGISQVEGNALAQQSEPDVGRLLSGRAAGVNVTNSSGLAGSGTNIIIRGYTTISGSNQPLFIVDGVPFDGGTVGDGQAPGGDRNFLDNYNESSRFLDIDPNNIESVNVLKGLSATVLYGDRGRNGVILITTKTGSGGQVNKKLEISVNQSVFATQAILPNYQDNYGGGFHQSFGYFFSNWGPRFDADLSGFRQFKRVDENGTTILQSPLAFVGDQTLVAGLEGELERDYPYLPYNSVEEFFRTGIVSNTSVSARGGGERATYNMNYSHVDETGTTPGNSLQRDNFGFGGRMQLSNRFRIDGSVLYVRTETESPPIAPSFGSGTGFDGASAFGDLLYTPRSVDIFGLPFESVDGRSLYYRSGNDIQNPRWTVRNSKTTSNLSRYFGKLGVTFDFTDWLNATYRLGVDDYTDLRTYGQNRGGVDGNPLGIYRTSTINNRIIDHSILINAERQLSDDIGLRVTLGGNARRDEFERDGIESIEQLTFGILRHYNFVENSQRNSFSSTDIPYIAIENRLGVYMDAQFSYRDFLFINASARNDWTSTLEPGNNTIFYPGGSVAFVPTSAFAGLRQNPVLNYLKLRVGYGSSAGFPTAYRTRNTLALEGRSFSTPDGTIVSANEVSTRLGNPDLKPERVSEIELGIDTRLFGRVSVNASVFEKATTDLITDQSLDFSTGFSVTEVNIGELRVRGLEIEGTIDVLELNSGLVWQLNGNFAAIRNDVIDLDDNTDRILLSQGVIGEGSNYAIEGKPYGIIQGTTIQRVPEGNPRAGELVVDGDGNYLENTELMDLGDPVPKWTSGFGTTLQFKGLTFTMNWQFRYGGDIYSLTAPSLIGRGVVDADNPINREALYILPGVVEVADGVYEENTTMITATDVGFDNYGFGPNEFRMFDGTTLRLNDISLEYALPSAILENTPFGRVSFAVSGFNLWYRSYGFPKDVNFDTNTLSTGVGNALGIDFISAPSSRRFGGSVRVTF